MATPIGAWRQSTGSTRVHFYLDDMVVLVQGNPAGKGDFYAIAPTKNGYYFRFIRSAEYEQLKKVADTKRKEIYLSVGDCEFKLKYKRETKNKDDPTWDRAAACFTLSGLNEKTGKVYWSTLVFVKV
jgi:hypothetical protein